jgi:SAM-dependent methyltransferase
MAPGVTRQDPEYAGQAGYTAAVLRVYDILVLRGAGHFAWRCPPGRLVGLYDDNVSSPHLDIGVGTGYALDRCRHRTPAPDISLMDLNRNSLAAASSRLKRFEPKTHQGNALEPFDLPADRFASVGMNWLLHCLPGDIASKSVVFGHCRSVLAPGGVVFGSTVLNGGVRHTPWSRLIMERLNAKGLFSNLDDDLDGLKNALREHFAHTAVEVVGVVAMFSAR